MKKLLMLVLIFSAVLVRAEDKISFKTNDGIEIKDGTVTKVEPDGITVMHSAGAAKFLFSNLPSDIQSRFGYNSQKEAEYIAQSAVKKKAQQEMEVKAATPSIDQQIQASAIKAEVKVWVLAGDGAVCRVSRIYRGQIRVLKDTLANKIQNDKEYETKTVLLVDENREYLFVVGLKDPQENQLWTGELYACGKAKYVNPKSGGTFSRARYATTKELAKKYLTQAETTTSTAR